MLFWIIVSLAVTVYTIISGGSAILIGVNLVADVWLMYSYLKSMR